MPAIGAQKWENRPIIPEWTRSASPEALCRRVSQIRIGVSKAPSGSTIRIVWKTFRRVFEEVGRCVSLVNDKDKFSGNHTLQLPICVSGIPILTEVWRSQELQREPEQIIFEIPSWKDSLFPVKRQAFLACDFVLSNIPIPPTIHHPRHGLCLNRNLWKDNCH